MKKPRKQCRKCPFKVSTDPNEIPDGYCEVKHAGLSKTIAKPGEFRVGAPLRMMACHETMAGAELPCVGWLAHQLGDGNNIALRIAVATGRVDGNVVTVGRQHRTLEDTLPKPKPAPKKRSQPRTQVEMTSEVNRRRFAAWAMRAGGASYKEIGTALDGITESRAREVVVAGAHGLARRVLILSNESPNDPPWLRRLRAAGALPRNSVWTIDLINELIRKDPP